MARPTAFLVESIGARTCCSLPPQSAVCVAIVLFVLRREEAAGTSDPAKAVEEKARARSDSAAAIVAQTCHRDGDRIRGDWRGDHRTALNMAAAEAKGATNSDARSSLPGHGLPVADRFVIQVGLTAASIACSALVSRC
jgi:hypothetical protein